MSGRGTRFNPNQVNAIRKDMLGDNIISRIEEELNPSAVTIDKRLEVASREIDKIRTESFRIQRLAADCEKRAIVFSRSGQKEAARAQLKQKLMLENQFKQYSDMIVSLEASKGKAILAKTAEKVSESFRLIENVISSFNKNTSSTDADNTMTDIDFKSKKVDGNASIYGQPVTDDQRDAESEVDAALADLEDKLADEVELSLPRVANASSDHSGRSAARALGGTSRQQQHSSGGHGSASSPAILEAEFEGGGVMALQQQRKPKHRRPPPPPTPPPIPPLTTSSIRPRSAKDMTADELEDVLPIVSNRRPPTPPTPPPPGSMSPSSVSRSPPPFSPGDRITGGGEKDHGRKTTPSPRQRMRGLHESETEQEGVYSPRLDTPGNSREVSDEEESDEIALKRKERKTKRRRKQKTHKKPGQSSTPFVPTPSTRELKQLGENLNGADMFDGPMERMTTDDELDDYLLFD